MSNGAKTEEKASAKVIILGVLMGIIKPGLLIAVFVYLLNSLWLQHIDSDGVTIISSLLGILAYGVVIFYSTTKANRHQSPEAATKDSLGDLVLFAALLAIALIWTFLPIFSGMKVDSGNYYVMLAFFWAMFVFCFVEAIFTISNSLYQMFRLEQIRVDK